MIEKATLEDLMFTLEVCKQHLPENSHPAHYARLYEMQRILKRMINREQHAQAL